MTAPQQPAKGPSTPAMTRDNVLAICRRHEAYGKSPKLTLHGEHSIVAALRDVLLAMATHKVDPLALADALDRTLPPTPAPYSARAAVPPTTKHTPPGTTGAPAAPAATYPGSSEAQP